jgi:hypothetical protein
VNASCGLRLKQNGARSKKTGRRCRFNSAA